MKHSIFPAAILASLTLALPTSADVFYSGYLGTSIPTDFDGVDITLNGGELNFFFGGFGIANDANLQPFRDGTDGLDTYLSFANGELISNASGSLATGPGGSQDHVGDTFNAGQECYIGFKLNDADYGWVRVELTNNNTGALIKDWAYNTGGGSIATGDVLQSGTTYTLDSSAQDFTLSSLITGSNSVVVQGGNTVTLAGENTYTGTTNINAGTLTLGANGSIANSSTITVGSGGTLDVSALTGNWTLEAGQKLTGSGGVTGSVTIEGTHNAGDPASNNGVGSQAITGSLTYASGSIFEWDINQSSTIEGFDTVSATGTGGITAESGSIFHVVFGDTAFNELGNTFWNAEPYASQTWSMQSIFGTNISGAFASVTTSTTVSSFGSFSINGSNLTWTAIPEPSTALAGLLLAAGLLRRKR